MKRSPILAALAVLALMAACSSPQDKAAKADAEMTEKRMQLADDYKQCTEDAAAFEQAKKDGFVRTWMGRRRYLPDLTSRNRVLRQAAERMATNTVIQGTAADLIKKAMVDVDGALREAGLSATMILQVHDELVFETSEAEREALAYLVRERMEQVADLSVPLTVDLGHGANWREAH